VLARRDERLDLIAQGGDLVAARLTEVAVISGLGFSNALGRAFAMSPKITPDRTKCCWKSAMVPLCRDESAFTVARAARAA
jgi:hypothetical protein